MLAPGIAQLHGLRCGVEAPSAGIAVGRGVSASSYKPPFEDDYARHLQRLEDIRLVGYRYLKPPGVTKTLRTLHEDEAYGGSASAADASFSSASESRDMLGAASEPDSTAPAPRTENTAMQVDGAGSGAEDSDGDAPDFSLPALNASFPSLYYQS